MRSDAIRKLKAGDDTVLLPRGMHYDPITSGKNRYGGRQHGLLVNIGSRSPRRRSFTVTAARLGSDAHRIGGGAAWRVAADGYFDVRADDFAQGTEPVKGICDFPGSGAAVDTADHAGGDQCWRIYRVAAARHLRL